MQKFVIVLAAAAVAGCATQQVYWQFPSGGTEQQFDKDDYACMQETQQQTSSAYVNPYGGTAESGTTTNVYLYKACMNARGYREGQAPN